MMPLDQGKLYPLRFEEGVGSCGGVKNGAPRGGADVRSVRTSLASLTAPSTLTWPAPCSNMLKPASGCAVYIRIVLTMFGVRLGLTCSSKAAAPATTGADIDVPLRYISLCSTVVVSSASSCGLRVSS